MRLANQYEISRFGEHLSWTLRDYNTGCYSRGVNDDVQIHLFGMSSGSDDNTAVEKSDGFPKKERQWYF